MTFASSLPLDQLSSAKKKRVLLVDSSARQREMRSEAMRKLGMDVDCAADIVEARSWWRPELYDLVLIHAEGELVTREKFCADVRGANPPQQLAFLVGKPGYLSDSPSGHDESDTLTNSGFDGGDQVARVSQGEGTPQHWGILEACRRISEVRSLATARSKALRDRPAPPRDPERRPTPSESVKLAEKQERNFDEESLRW